MGVAIMQFDETTASKVRSTSDNPAPPVDWPVHGYLNEGYPPGSKLDWVQCHSILMYMWLRVDAADIPPDFEKTGPNGFFLMWYFTTIQFLLPCAMDVEGFVGGVSVTNQRRFALAGTAKAVMLEFPETEITANWDGAKGYLIKAQMEELELRCDFENGGPGDVDPPERL